MPQPDRFNPCSTPSYIGIDPGKTGGIAVINPAWDLPRVYPMPKTEQAVWSLLRETAHTGSKARFMIEKVWARPGQGVVSTATFLQGYGFLRGCLVAGGFSFSEVTPQKWIRCVNVPAKAKAEKQSAWKKRLRQSAENLFPGAQLTNDTADALLLAFYCQIFHTQEEPAW